MYKVAVVLAVMSLLKVVSCAPGFSAGMPNSNDYSRPKFVSRFVRSAQAPSGVPPSLTNIFASIFDTDSEPENSTEPALSVESSIENNSTYSLEQNETSSISNDDDDDINGSSSTENSTTDESPSLKSDITNNSSDVNHYDMDDASNINDDNSTSHSVEERSPQSSPSSGDSYGIDHDDVDTQNNYSSNSDGIDHDDVDTESNYNGNSDVNDVPSPASSFAASTPDNIDAGFGGGRIVSDGDSANVSPVV